MLKLNELESALRQRIQRQLAKEDAAKNCEAHKNASNQRVDRVVDSIRQQDQASALVKDRKVRSPREGRVAIVATITSYRSRELDDDNLIAGAKPLRDCIARSLALDDADKRLRFEYRQVITTGATGTHVLITRL